MCTDTVLVVGAFHTFSATNRPTTRTRVAKATEGIPKGKLLNKDPARAPTLSLAIRERTRKSKSAGAATVSRLAISELRKRKRRRLVSLTGFFQAHDGSENCELDPVDERPLQDTELVATERRLAVQRAISTLPEKYRAPLILRDVEGRSYEEISRILQTSEGTVKSRISRARDFLREKMRAYL